jgi:hypothetical protein
MIGDLDISGVFLPTLLVLMGITYVLFVLVHGCSRACTFTAWSGTGHCSTWPLRRAAGAVDSLSRYLMT